MPGLSVSDVVNVEISLAPLATPLRNFGALLIAGASDVIDVTERIRFYASLTELTVDFGTTTPEYLAAALFFDQSPQPATVYVGRWAKTATHAILHGAVFNAAQQATLLTALKLIATGTMQITVDGVLKSLTAMDFTGIATLSGAAAIITTALAASASCTWNLASERFEIVSTTTGALSLLTYATAGVGGTSIAALIGLTTGLASAPVAGIASETPLAATAIFAQSGDWYGLTFADAAITTAQHTDVAGFIEGVAPSRIYAVTTQESAAIDSASAADLGSILKALNYQRTFIQYSTSSPYAAVSAFGRAFTVDFSGNNTVITLKFKTEPGIAAETLSETQAATLAKKNINVFINYNNSVAFIQEGKMANGFFFDEVHGGDWLANAIQTAVFNLLYSSTTKIPQTEPGIHLIFTEVEATCVQAVNNGLLAPGVWTGPSLGILNSGDTLPKGYYVFAPPIAQQLAADRAARKAPTMQIAAKLAGAIHFANVLVTLNR